MKVLILTNNDVGLYKFRKELLEELINSGFEVFVSLPDGDFVRNIVDLGCKFINTELNRRGKNPFQDIGLYNHYVRMIKDIKPDVVLTYTIKPNVYGGMACQRCKVPYLSNIAGLGSTLGKKGVLQTILIAMFRMALSKANKVFFQNQDNLHFMQENNIVKDNYELVPGSGVNLKQYQYSEYPDGDDVDFVFVGRTMKEKGFGLYLDTAEYIHFRHPNAKFHMCVLKEEDYEDRIHELVEKGACIYHGQVDNMQDIYKDIHCIIHPTYYPEGMSNVLLEACACGRPAITTDREGCKEIIDDGINGYIVRQKDLDDLIEKVERFLALDSRSKADMGKAAREKVEKQFDRQIVIDKYMQEIRKYAKES